MKTSDAPGDPEESDEDIPDTVEIPIEDCIDLHFFSPADAKAVVLEYLEQAAARGFREVRIIHGRGIGEQRRMVRTVLERSPHVERFADAPPTRGGWGTTLAWLKPPAP